MLTRCDNATPDWFSGWREASTPALLASVSFARPLIATSRAFPDAMHAECSKLVAAAPVEQRRAAMNRALRASAGHLHARGLRAIAWSGKRRTHHHAGEPDVLFNVIAGCKTGQRRLKVLLPEVRVAHRTGLDLVGHFRRDRCPRLTADVSVIDLPQGRGRIAVAAFVVDLSHAIQAQERVIARLTRTTYVASKCELDLRPWGFFLIRLCTSRALAHLNDSCRRW